MAKPLDAYRSKRDFTVSAEPKGRAGRRSRQPRFVVQKHDARRLHYDLRLEVDGVLKSWAVTRGPSLVVGEKRLAVQTEDHPLDYLAWEGAIPKGQYGGGTMIVWDTGTWTPEVDVAAGLAKGHLEFTLTGERLKGRWHLVRMKGRGRETKQPWLLLKAEDGYARDRSATDVLEAFDTSVLSGRTNADIAAGRDLRADHKARERIAKLRGRKIATARPTTPAGRKAVLPPFVAPALATPADTAPRGENWLFEIKLDGYRIQARIDGGRVKLLTRSGLDWTAKFKPLTTALKALKLPSALIDGEIIVEDASGVSSFSALQQALAAGDTSQAVFCAFDLLYLDGRDTRSLPLVERKALLQQAMDDLPAEARLRFSEHLASDGEAMARHACRLGLEGIIAKRADAAYHSGRSDLWRKVKCETSAEFVIAGFTPSTTAPRAVGSLILGLYEGKALVHVGRVGTGFTNAVATALWRELEPLRIERPPFDAPLPPLARRSARWVEPTRVCEISYRAWTADGHLRHAAFKTMRPDVSPKAVKREKAPTPRGRRSAGASADVRLTHPDRVLWGDVGLTKQGLYDFYDAVADVMLPYVVERPLALLRCPDGVGSCFFQKHAWAGMDTHIRSERAGPDAVLVIRDRAGLLALVQASALEIHPWGARLSEPDRPDRLVFDLDPGEGVAWAAVVAGAFEVKARMEALGFAAFAKTTGGKGLHVVVPLRPQAGWAAAKAFTAKVAEAMARDAPDRYVSTITKRARSGRVFIDYLRNQHGATAAAAFSTRARPGAPVSVPVAWDELASLGSGSRYIVANLMTRLAAMKSDPWAEFSKKARPLA